MGGNKYLEKQYANQHRRRRNGRERQVDKVNRGKSLRHKSCFVTSETI